MKCQLLCCIAAILCLSAFVSAQIPDDVEGLQMSVQNLTVKADTILVNSSRENNTNVMNYQGFLSDASGNPITGTMQAVISIWTADIGGANVWQEEQVIDANFGYFTVELGRKNPIPNTIFTGTPRWIELSIDGTTLSPRKQIVSVPLAMYAGNAGMLANTPADQFYTKTQANDNKRNDIDASSLGGFAASEYYTRNQLENNFVSRTSINTVTSDMIRDGTIKTQDLGFQLGTGTITAVNPGNGLVGGGMGGAVTLSLSPDYFNGTAYDQRFVRKSEPRVITGGMIAEGSITSDNIKNGTILAADLGFSVSTISQIVSGPGLAGGGNSGSVTISLNSDYLSGIAYDKRFINHDDENAITSLMVKDGELTGIDIKNSSLTQEDMGFNIGDITAINTINGLVGGSPTGEVTLQLAPSYYDGSAYDNRFPRKDQPSVTSLTIVDGTIQPQDLSFPAGDITRIIAGTGLTTAGTGDFGDVTVRLDDSYASGQAYDSRFVSKQEINGVTGMMIKDGDVGANDIGNGALRSNHFTTPFMHITEYANGALFKVTNTSISPLSHGIEARGYNGVKGYGTLAGVHGEGEIYGVYAKATNITNPVSFSLYVDGRARCTNGTWSDVAELIYGEAGLEAGDVVVIDPDGRYRVKKCEKHYDGSLAGVISTDPTIMVGGVTETGYPLTLTGIVPCKVSAENGAVRAGDLLTTSSTPGHAMKATEPKSGTIVGKALESMDSGTGVIQVLVNLM